MNQSRSTIIAGIVSCLAIVRLGAGENPAVLPQQPPAQVKLTGITVLPPDKWALLEVTEYQQPASTMVLAEGERRADLRVLEIDPQCRWVRISCAGRESTLTTAARASAPEVTAEAGGEHRPLPLLPPPDAGDP